MAVQPLSDPVFEVVKAADATRSGDVIGKLRDMASGDGGAFAANLSDASARASSTKTDRDAAEKAAALLPAGMAFSGATLTGLRNAHALSQRSSTADVASSQSAVSSGAKAQAKAASLRKFEGMMLSQFFDTMMPAQKGVFGAGVAGSTWKTLLTEKLGARMADAGGIGMATRLARASVAQDAKRALKGTIS